MNTETIEARFAQLEKSNKNLRRVLFTVLALSVAICFVAANHSSSCTVTANRFVLVDDKCKQRATLGFEDGGPVFAIKDSKGDTKIQLAYDQHGSGSSRLYLTNETKRSFVIVSATTKDGSSTIEFGGGRKRISFRTNLPGDDPDIRLTDEEGNETLYLPERAR